MAENQLDRLFSRSCPPRSVGPPAARASGERRLRLRQLRAFRPPRRPCPEISTGSCLLTIGSTPATSQEATRPQQSRQLKWLYASCFSLPKLAFQIRSPLFRAGCAWIFAAAPSKTPRGAHKKLIRLILCVKINWGFARNKRVSVYLPERSRSRAELVKMPARNSVRKRRPSRKTGTSTLAIATTVVAAPRRANRWLHDCRNSPRLPQRGGEEGERRGQILARACGAEAETDGLGRRADREGVAGDDA